MNFKRNQPSKTLLTLALCSGMIHAEARTAATAEPQPTVTGSRISILNPKALPVQVYRGLRLNRDYDFNQYNADGRVVYARYTQTF